MVNPDYIASLPQIDMAEIHVPADGFNLPAVFIPVRGAELPVKNVKYALVFYGDSDDRRYFYTVCLNAFKSADGKNIVAGTRGGIVDAVSFINQGDASWLAADSRLLGAEICGNSVVRNESVVKNSKVSASVVDHSVIVNSQLSDCQISKESLVTDYCRLAHCVVEASQLQDRVVAENSKIFQSFLKFCAVEDSQIYDERLSGLPHLVQQKKIYDYISPLPQPKDKKTTSAIKNSWFPFKRRQR